MSWATDTDKLLENGTVVTVKSTTSVYTATSVVPSTSTVVIETATVLIFPKAGAFKKEVKGRVVENTHVIFFPDTSTVAVGHRVYEPDDTDYHEVLDVRDYDGHKQIYTEKVSNR